MIHFWIALAGGAAAFAHCLGMCGVFALHIGQEASPLENLKRQLLWHVGKTGTYTFMGAIAGVAGSFVHSSSWPAAQNVLAWITGIIMVLCGLSLLGMLPIRAAIDRLVGPRSGAAGMSGQIFSQLFGQLFRQPSSMGALALGTATGFLPCPLVVGFLVMAAQTGSVAGGMLIMAAMGVGTIWSLLALGMTGQYVRLRLRRQAAVLGGVVVIALGTVTLLRATDAYHHLLGCPSSGESQQAQSPAKPCCHGQAGQ